ncbi:uncharacterized protein N7479_010959 [Penicillium vulpinum]|uniref:Uncharacterized protein n=1 Tax=Penicillium vulpinum TaxID=29845 RepID=A0A1V6S0E8_9EURO|nr:uncharacterized protein N7479_010959 [Penicillium vulpinum]KAJ5952546.1 hypothetical protein N7479_010959 [Penicillium vulpinum]OQE07214.1 hypothetical protein PENVUL_c014G01028 [Penicillium vulpinum]
MSVLNVDNSIQVPNTQNTTPLSPVGHLQYAQKDSGSESISPVYEGFTFSKAMPKESATWICVKRTAMHLNQDEYFRMVQKRANKKSVAQQYQGLSSDTRRAHINQLIDEKRHNNPLVEWSCVYIKEHTKIFKAKHARHGDYETVSMDVIIKQMPMKAKAYYRASVGCSVAIGNILRPTLQQLAPAMNSFAHLNSTRGPAYENPNGQFESTNPDVETSHPTRSQDHEPIRSTVTNDRRENLAFSTRNSNEMSLDHTSDYSSDSSSDPDDDDASMISDQSDETSATDDETETECQEPQPDQASLRQQNASPYRHEASYAPHSWRKFQGHNIDRRNDRNYPFRDQFEVPPVKTANPRRAQSARPGSVPSKRYRMQLMNDNEIRSRMLDHREASLGHREKWLKRTFSEAQLEGTQPVRDPPAVCRCTCRCAIKGKREAV